MLGRNRRVRFLVLLAIGVVVFVVYNGNTKTIVDYGDRVKDTVAEKVVGGGSVIRPKLDEDEYKPLAAERPEVEVQPTTVTPEASTSTTTTAVAVDTTPTSTTSTTTHLKSSTSLPLTTPTPQPAPQAASGITDYDHDLPYQGGEGEGRLEVTVVPAIHHTTSVEHWISQTEHFPISSTIQLPSGTSTPFPRIQRAVQKLSANGADEPRLAVIKEATKHAWDGYREYAWAKDEIRPVSGRSNNPFNGWGATLVDSLDTLWMMGMTEEFDEAVEAVKDIDFTTSVRPDIPIFETTIRYLGGLVAAYDVSGREAKYRILLDKSVELAEVLYSIFDTPNRMPQTFYRWKPAYASQPHRAGQRVVLAEIGTLSLEFTRLAQLTGEPKYYDAIARITDAFEEWQNNTRLPGMWPTSLDASGCGKPVSVPATGTQTTSKQLVPDGSGMQMQAGGAVQAGGKAEKSQKSLNEAVAAREPGQGRIVGFGDTAEDAEAPAKKVVEESVQDGAPREKSQAGLNEAVAAHEPGQGRIAGFGDGVEEGKATDKLSSNLGSSKRKRQLEFDPAAIPQTFGDDVTDHAPIKNTQATVEARTPPELLPKDQPTSNLSPEPICIPQGLASTSATTQETFTLSGASDSMYEYLPKEYLLLGGQVDSYRSMYLSSAAAAIERLLFKPMTIDERDILLSGEVKLAPNLTQPLESRGYIEHFNAEAAHLACFAGGMFAMGGVLFDKPEHVEIGSKLTDGCVWAYNVTATGMMPEGANVMKCADTWGDCPWNETAYWHELDPYEATRTRVALPVPVAAQTGAVVPGPVQPVAPVAPITPAAPGVPVAPRPARMPGVAGAVAAMKEEEAGNAAVAKAAAEKKAEALVTTEEQSKLVERQLGEAVDVEHIAGQPALVLAAATTDKPTTTTNNIRPVYVKPAPLPHKDYVQHKIADERLPPGFVKITGRKYILRPEAIESVFYMYRITGDQHWRDVGWDMFVSIDTHTRVLHGHSAVDDVTKTAPEPLDSMESFWVAETLKYFYLLFDDPDVWTLDDWVLNTEAHFFRRPKYEFEEV